MELLTQWMKTLLTCSCICTVLLLICPEGYGKTLVKTGCVCLMLMALVSPVRGQHLHSYVEAAAEFQQEVLHREKQLEGSVQSFSRTVMEREYAAYILSEAASRQIPLTDVQVETVWSAEGFWLPSTIRYPKKVPADFRREMQESLGISAGGEAG